VKWTVPGFTPVMATADGGVIGESSTDQYVTFNQNGVATGMVADMPILSWKGAYQPGSVAAVVPPSVDIAQDWLPVLLGNFTGNGTAFRSWFFKLVWDNDSYFIPDNPNELTELQTDLSSDAMNAVKASALRALKQAYFAGNPTQGGWPVIVSEGAAHTGDDWAIVLNHQTLDPGQVYGATDPNNILCIHGADCRVHESQVDYTNVMEQAQWALNVSITNAQERDTVLQQRRDLLLAIGRAIGNTAAHEIAHHFLEACCSMDVSVANDPNARGSYNVGQSSPVSDPSFFTGFWPDPIIPLHWEAPTFVGLNNCLNSSRGWQDAAPRNGGTSFCFTGWQ
jgi:hypothetical protein